MRAGRPRVLRIRSANEADTDVSVPANRDWLAAQLVTLDAHGVHVVPAVLGGRTVTDGQLADGRDPAAPDSVAYRWVQADETQVEEAVATARAAGERWPGAIARGSSAGGAGGG